MQQMIDNMTFADRMPFFEAIETGADRNLWLATSVGFVSDSTNWVVFSERGDPVGRVTLPQLADVPRPMDLLDTGEDYILALAPDALGVERVVLYEIIKPGRQ